jgi:hypothetical protein
MVVVEQDETLRPEDRSFNEGVGADVMNRMRFNGITAERGSELNIHTIAPVAGVNCCRPCEALDGATTGMASQCADLTEAACLRAKIAAFRQFRQWAARMQRVGLFGVLAPVQTLTVHCDPTPRERLSSSRTS